MPPPGKPSFIRQWGLLVAFGIFSIGSLLGFRYWTEAGANAPISSSYASYIRYAELHSPSAREYLMQYYAKYARSTVASQDFPHVCGMVTIRADADGIDMSLSSKAVADACRRAVEYVPPTDER
jgi:hypothetical protein